MQCSVSFRPILSGASGSRQLHCLGCIDAAAGVTRGGGEQSRQDTALLCREECCEMG